jgi:hypothetical protein
MLLHKLLATAAIVGLAAGAMAADLPREGSFKGTYTDIGTYKTTKIGDRTLVFFDETAAQLTDGFADHMAFHCWGTTEVADGQASNQGYCTATDPTGDLIEAKFVTDKHPFGKPAKGTSSYIAGTGKYTGINATVTYATEGQTFRAPEGTYVGVISLEGHYKLP